MDIFMRKKFYSRIGIMACILAGMIVLTGCLYVGKAADESAGHNAVEGQMIQIQETENSVSVERSGTKEEEVTLTEEEKFLLRDLQADSYAFHQLSDDEQEIYLEILWTLLNFQENVTLSSMDEEEISRMFQCVLNDHPEIFYVDGYTYTQYTLGDILKRITFTGTYPMDREEIDGRQARIDEYVKQCFSGITTEMDEYEKVKHIYEYLIDHTEYDASAKDNQNICSVFLDGRSVCQGYAKATQYLLQQAGISTTLILGEVSQGEGHAWNAVRIDGQWYYVDTTWGDASYQAVGGEESYPQKAMPTINYDYLCVTTEQLCKTHTIENVVIPPECNSMEANYYVKEGLYFTTLDKEQLTRIFKEGYERGNAYVTLKCASKELYEQMQDMLITEQEIFQYLDCPDGVVSYTDDDKQYSMSFWL